MAAEVKTMFFGALGAKKIENALKRILRSKAATLQWPGSDEDCGEAFLGVPYTVVSAHSRHIQQSCYLDGDETRRDSGTTQNGPKVDLFPSGAGLVLAGLIGVNAQLLFRSRQAPISMRICAGWPVLSSHFSPA